MSLDSKGDIFTLPLRGDRIMELKHFVSTRVDRFAAVSYYSAPRDTFDLGWRISMKRLVPLPCGDAEHLKNTEETGFSYQVVSLQLKAERIFEERSLIAAWIISAHAHKDIPLLSND